MPNPFRRGTPEWRSYETIPPNLRWVVDREIARRRAAGLDRPARQLADRPRTTPQSWPKPPPVTDEERGRVRQAVVERRVRLAPGVTVDDLFRNPRSLWNPDYYAPSEEQELLIYDPARGAAMEARRARAATDMRTIGPVPGVPETGAASWRRSHDALIPRVVQDFNASRGFLPGDPVYVTPQFVKRWAMVEGRHPQEAFLRDPMQAFVPGDTAPDKRDFLLRHGYPDPTTRPGAAAVTPELSFRAALDWLYDKAEERDDAGRVARVNNLRTAIERYNGRRDLQRDIRGRLRPFRETYADRVFGLLPVEGR